MNVLNILCFMFKCKIKACPHVFHSLYTLNPPNKYNTRSAEILVEPLCRTKFEQFNISYRATHLWNKLVASNSEISNVKTFGCFRNKLKNLLLNIENIFLFFDLSK